MSAITRVALALLAVLILAPIAPVSVGAAEPPVKQIEIEAEHGGDDDSVGAAKAKPAKFGLDKISIAPKRAYAREWVRFGSRVKGGPAEVWYAVADSRGRILYVSLPCWCGNGAIWIYDVFPTAGTYYVFFMANRNGRWVNAKLKVRILPVRR
ncbi:MAG: hypothetical protein IT340_03320 [Chloroflexi bacterium]|nr:hypothetical protein [Chloroflexota bacterium]